MGIKIEEGTLKVSAGYSLKVGLPNYSSKDAHASYSIDVDVTDVESELAIDMGGKLYDQLTNAAKLSVMATLGLEAEVDDDGVLQPKLGAPQAAPAPAPAPVPYSGGGSQSYTNPNPQPSGNGGFAPKANLDAEPRFTADLDGKGVTTWIDLRGVKQRGDFKPTAADFRDAANAKHQVWLTDKQGNVKASVAQALQAAGVNV